jgi:hypothetical protein
MPALREGLWSVALLLAALFFSMAALGLVSIFVLNSTSFSLAGCATMMAVSAIVLGAACWRSSEPALKTLQRVAVYCTMLIVFLLAVGIVSVIFKRGPDAVSSVLFLIFGGTFLYLRGVVLRMNAGAK